MKKIISLLIPFILFASIIDDFKNKNYEKICTVQNYKKYINNSKMLNLIGLACVKIDKLVLLTPISFRLRKDKISRKNSIYFLTLVLEKRLIYSYFFDGNRDIFYFSFPKTNYFLSDIFDAIKNKHFKKEGNIYIIQNKNKIYKIFKNGTFLEIDEYKNNKIKRHLFR